MKQCSAVSWRIKNKNFPLFPVSIRIQGKLKDDNLYICLVFRLNIIAQRYSDVYICKYMKNTVNSSPVEVPRKFDKIPLGVCKQTVALKRFHTESELYYNSKPQGLMF